MKAQSYEEDLIADRRQGHLLFSNAFRVRDPTDLSSVEMGPNMRKGSLPLVTVLGTKCHRNAESVSVVSTENTIF